MKVANSIWIGLVTAAAGFSACAFVLGGGPEGNRSDRVGQGTTRRSVPPATTATPDGGAAAAVNRFALKLVVEAAQSDLGKNVLVSPLSVVTAHAMLMAGTEGGTYRELHEALTPDLPTGDVQDDMRALLGGSGGAEGARLQVANGFFKLERKATAPSYEATLRKCYGVRTIQLDGDGPASLKAINDWAKAKTDGMIPEALRDLPKQAAFVLLNSAAFHGKWLVAFEPKATADAPFTLGDGKTIEVPTMRSGKMRVRSMVTPQVNAVKLDYASGAYGMVLLLPAAGGDPAKILAELDDGLWNAIVRSAPSADLMVMLPRFRFDGYYDLIPMMKKMGVNRVFTAEAQLDGMGPIGRGNLVATDVHATHVEVDENGTRAAATTAIVGAKGGGQPTAFKVDRPFAYAIVDNKTGMVAFIGICRNPLESK